MKRQQELWTLEFLAAVFIVLIIALYALRPTVNSVPLPAAELEIALCKLQPSEYAPLYRWLVLDFVFAGIYTVLYTWGLRWLAADAPSAVLGTLGRVLSWVTALAIVFDIAENLILWVGASVGAPHVSPWLFALVKLKKLSAAIFLSYAIAWCAWRYFPRAAREANSSP